MATGLRSCDVRPLHVPPTGRVLSWPDGDVSQEQLSPGKGGMMSDMAVTDIHREHVLEAVAEFDRIGRQSFLHQYGFGHACAYLLVEDGQEYDSKAIVGVAHRYARPDLGPLNSSTFSGGMSGAAGLLARLGFAVSGIPAESRSTRASSGATATGAPIPSGATTDLILIGCVKTKLDVSAPAEELYISPLFRKRRTYAESNGGPWFVISALHGLVAPGDVVAPYDMALAAQSVQFRRAWGHRVAAQLREICNLAGQTVEIHAGSAYVDVLEPLLLSAGASVRVPLRGLSQGQHLAWYSRPLSPSVHTTAPDVAHLVAALTDPAAVQSCQGFPWERGDLNAPGLYSWWVDTSGARELTVGLGHPVSPGLVYAGQAGADSTRTSTASEATLRSRIGRQHLAGSIGASTWRRTLQAILAMPSPAKLTSWMHEHLGLITVPVSDRRTLMAAEKTVLDQLDPPLNLMGMPASSRRQTLRALRREL